MKTIIQYLLIAILSVSSFNILETQAKNPKVETVLSEKVQVKINENISDLIKKMSKDLSLSTKQTKKIHAIKLGEATEIEIERSHSKSQQEIKNQIILISNDADKKIMKALKKDQEVLYEAHKSEYKYNPGWMENLKDIYKDTKEAIKEKLGIR